jgi:DNA repair ATPase RecN
MGTNAYLFFKDKKANDRIVTISDEKTRMQTEIDKIEAELDNSSGDNVKLSEQMQNEQTMAREKIQELRIALKKGQLTQGQLKKAQEDIKQLRYFVTKYTADIDVLRKQNVTLITERDELKTAVDSVSSKANDLERQNQELSTKVQAAAALKTGNVSVSAFEMRNNGKENGVTRASTAEKIRINFSAVNNSIAEKGLHDIYFRVIDPSGNLIVSTNGGLFTADDEEFQYTYKTAIEFANDGKAYSIDWANPAKFQKGTYTVVLYADGYTMGKGAVTLR